VIKSKKREPDAKKAEYQLTACERATLDKLGQRRREANLAPRMKVLADGKVTTISPDHPDKVVARGLLMEALGTADHDFVDGLLRELANASSQDRRVDEGALNFLLAVIKGVKPKDQLEAMLSAQMAAIHMATMRFAQQLSQVGTIPQQDSAERALNKLARTFTTQIEALKRYRSGGEQKVTVQHVSVSDGGQAILGNVTQGKSEAAPNRPANLTPALTDARQPAMTIIGERERTPVPLARGEKDDGRSST
jgi:hypothetical protein